jgi:aminopeptidase N
MLMMIRLIFFIVFTTVFGHSFAQSNIDVLHYKFEIELSDTSDSLKGHAFVTLQFTQPTDRFWLNLVSLNGKGKGMIAYKVKEGNETLSSAHGHDSLTIWLKKPGRKNEARTFEILYSGIPADGLIISKNRYGYRTFFGDNWPDRAHNWIPCKDEPGDKASFEFLVTAPAQYQVISNGKLEEEKILAGNKKLTHWVEDVSLPTKVMVIGVAKFAVKQFEDSPPGIPVSAWVYPQDSVTGFRNYSPAPAIVKFFSGYIGPYPYNKLANVQSTTIFGGMENASSIFYDEESAERNRPIEDLLSHEIAHQWFGDMASEKSFPHLWLSEGFATYFSDMYLESKYGVDTLNKELIAARKRVIAFVKRSDRSVVDSVSPLMQLLNANSYQKGGWILHMLRRQMGDSLFHLFIGTYYDRYKGGNAETNDLRKVAEEVSHKDLQQFFRQWLYTPGIPQLEIQWKYNEKDKTISITINQIQPQQPFEFPLEVAFGPKMTKWETTTLNITKRTETFTKPVADPEVNLIVDPNTNLLFDAKIERITP